MRFTKKKVVICYWTIDGFLLIKAKKTIKIIKVLNPYSGSKIKEQVNNDQQKDKLFKVMFYKKVYGTQRKSKRLLIINIASSDVKSKIMEKIIRLVTLTIIITVGYLFKAL